MRVIETERGNEIWLTFHKRKKKELAPAIKAVSEEVRHEGYYRYQPSQFFGC
jgi:hypothetical protein